MNFSRRFFTGRMEQVWESFSGSYKQNSRSKRKYTGVRGEKTNKSSGKPANCSSNKIAMDKTNSKYFNMFPKE